MSDNLKLLAEDGRTEFKVTELKKHNLFSIEMLDLVYPEGCRMELTRAQSELLARFIIACNEGGK